MKMSSRILSKQLIHEVTTAQHRLVILKQGVPTTSPWHEHRQVGLFGGYYFHVGALGNAPPVFRVTPTDHETLS